MQSNKIKSQAVSTPSPRPLLRRGRHFSFFPARPQFRRHRTCMSAWVKKQPSPARGGNSAVENLTQLGSSAGQVMRSEGKIGDEVVHRISSKKTVESILRRISHEIPPRFCAVLTREQDRYIKLWDVCASGL